MGFNDLRRLIRERTRRLEETGLTAFEYQERQEAKALLEQLKTNYIIAYKERKRKWFEEHPDKHFFESTYEEFVRDCKLEEWLWYFISRIFDRTPEDIEVLNDYKEYDRCEEVLEIWTTTTK